MSENATPRTDAALDKANAPQEQFLREFGSTPPSSRPMEPGFAWEHLHLECLALERELSAANARIAELEKDAARYRWLRDHAEAQFAVTADLRNVDPECERTHQWFGRMAPEFLDAALDAAMSAKEKP